MAVDDGFPPMDESWTPDGSNTPQVRTGPTKVVDRNTVLPDPNEAQRQAHMRRQQNVPPPPPPEEVAGDEPQQESGGEEPLRDVRGELIEEIAKRSMETRQRQWEESVENGGDPYGILGPGYEEEPVEQQAQEPEPAPEQQEPMAQEPSEYEQRMAALAQAQQEQDQQAQKLQQWYQSLEQWQAHLQRQQAQPPKQETKPVEPPKPYEPPSDVVNEAATLWMSGDEAEAKKGINAILKEADRIARSQGTGQPQLDHDAIVQQATQAAVQAMQQQRMQEMQQNKEATRAPAAEQFSKEFANIAGNEKLMHLAGMEATRIEQEHPDWNYFQVFKAAGDSIQEAIGVSPQAATEHQGDEEMAQRQHRKAGTVVPIPSSAKRRRPPPERREQTRAEIIEQMRASRPGSGI